MVPRNDDDRQNHDQSRKTFAGFGSRARVVERSHHRTEAPPEKVRGFFIASHMPREWSPKVKSDPVVAIAGVTGAVGAEFIATLEKRRFPVARLKALASKRSAGKPWAFAAR